MKTLTQTLIVALTLLTASLTACVESDSKQKAQPDCQQASCEPEVEQKSSLLKATYLSAHLGTYASCPEDGYVPGAGLTPEPASELGADIAGDCENNCRAIVNCEDGQFSLNLSNSGEADASGIIVSKLELFKGSGSSVGTLPVANVIDVATGAIFDGELAAGESVSLRIDFMGPAQPYTMLDGDRTGHLEVTLESDNHSAIVIEGEHISALPEVAT